jgi:hypothetical protein
MRHFEILKTDLYLKNSPHSPYINMLIGVEYHLYTVSN